MNLEEFASAVIDHPSIKKKFLLHDILTLLGKDDNIGEDAAIVDFGGKKAVLIATDMISADFVKKAPFSAGYSSILAVVDDIYASGGTPLSAAIDVQASTVEALQELVKGARKAAEQFNVSISRGHTSLKPGCDAVACTMIGEGDFATHVSAGGAKPGDAVAIIWDPDGKRSPNGPYWDTVMFKTRDDVLSRRAVMCRLASKNVLHASKDISDAGIFGTALLMANFSRVGCEFDVTMLQAALAVQEFPDLLWFSTAYLTSGFLVALNKTRCAVAEKTCAGTGMKFHVIGHVVPGSQISLVQGDAKHVMFDWQKTPVFPAP